MILTLFPKEYFLGSKAISRSEMLKQIKKLYVHLQYGESDPLQVLICTEGFFFQQCMLLYVRSDKKRGDNFQSSVSHSHKLVDYCSSQLTADLHIVLLKNDSCIYQQNVYICVFERIFKREHRRALLRIGIFSRHFTAAPSTTFQLFWNS